ncbi:hypothetical protein MRX96_014089 [Rhipicephalus microplus]
MQASDWLVPLTGSFFPIKPAKRRAERHVTDVLLHSTRSYDLRNKAAFVRREYGSDWLTPCKYGPRKLLDCRRWRGENAPMGSSLGPLGIGNSKNNAIAACTKNTEMEAPVRWSDGAYKGEASRIEDPHKFMRSEKNGKTKS